jgi:hypothetical protein
LCSKADKLFVNLQRYDIESDEFLVVPGLSEEVLIGVTTMRKWRIRLDFENDNVIIDPKVAKPILINLIMKD